MTDQRTFTPPPQRNGDQNAIAQAITDVSERAQLLVREEIELAKAELMEKVSKLVKGAVVGIAAGIFAVAALLFVLHGLAWLAWFELFPDQQFFWGFFVVAGALLLLALALAGPAPAVPLAAAGPAAAAWGVGARRRRYRRAVERGLPEIGTATADALAAGRSVRAALESATGSLEGPPGAEMARVRADLELGASTADALAALRTRMRSPRIDALCAALATHQLAGGDLAELLRRFAAAAAERERIAAEARSATAQARFTGLLVVAMPLGAAGLAELAEPGFVGGMLANSISLVLIGVAAALQLVGFAAIKRLGRVDPPS